MILFSADDALASATAARRLPGPESLPLVTSKFSEMPAGTCPSSNSCYAAQTNRLIRDRKRGLTRNVGSMLGIVDMRCLAIGITRTSR